MAYNTGNPIGSIDARDLYDNAQNMDKAVNQTTARWTDRLGVSRPSWSGMSHYNNVGEYTAGILITGYNEVFRYDGEFYRAAADTTLPYTTTGSWSEDGPLFVPVGDAVLRHDMAYEADIYIGYYRNAINCSQYGGLEAAATDVGTLGKTIVVTDTQDVSIPLDFTGRNLSVEYGGLVTFSGSGSITGLEETRPEWFGVNTTPGTTDMAQAVSAAMDSLVTGGTLILSPVDYALDTVAAHTGSINIEANGARLLPSTTASAITLTGNATPIITTTASAVINLGADHVSLASVDGIAAGQIVKLVSSTLWYYDNRGTLKKGELHVVDRVSGNDVYFTDVTYDSYNSPTETVTVTTYEPAEFHVNNLLIEYPANTAATSGISYTLAKNSTMDNVSVKNAAIAGIGITQSVGTIINGGTVEGCNNNVVGGYGVSIGDSYNTKISKVTGRHNWRTVDFTGGTIPSRDGLVHGCSADGGGLGTNGTALNLISTGFGTHGGAEGIIFSNNTVTNVYSGFVSRGNNISLFNNTLVGAANSFCEMSYGNNLLIDGNRSESLDSQRTSYTTPALDTFRALRFLYIGATVEPTAKITVINNYAKVVSRFIYSTIDLTGFTAMGNKIDFDPAGAADAVAVFASANNVLADSVIRNNSVEANTTGTVYKTLLTVCGISNQVDGCGPYSGYRRNDEIITEAAAKPSTVLNGGATTGTINAGSASLVVSAATGLAAGQSITIVGVTGIKRILTLVGTTATLDSVSDASVVGAAVSYYLADAVRGTVVKNWYPYAYGPKGWIALSATAWMAFGPATGTTAQRPADLDANDAGFQYWDSTISKPIWWNGTGWELSDGTGA